jgi:hypothetical protein
MKIGQSSLARQPGEQLPLLRVEHACDALDCEPLVGTDRVSRSDVRPSPGIDNAYTFLSLEDCPPNLASHQLASRRKGDATSGANNRNEGIRQRWRPDVNPRGKKIYPATLGADRLRAVASRIFLRKRRDLGVASTYSSGPMYSSERSSVMTTGGASWMPLPSP